uniref:Integrase catalytic domain-containing protein n=1 Tax=Tanacetum cinerariifolium TaxID=118510 RepID=A0A6L2JN10_TANCI|nr:hypothetical protein [Tanacetum cinerariifolium]
MGKYEGYKSQPIYGIPGGVFIPPYITQVWYIANSSLCVWWYDVTLSRYKARLVTNGHTQLEGVDVDETFSMVVKLVFQNHVHPDYVCLLEGSLYGLKLASRAWFQRFASNITRVGSHQSRCDSFVYIYILETNTAHLLLYVDDIVLTASSETLLQQFISSLHQRKYVVEILKRAHMANCNPSRTPVDIESKLGDDVQQVCLHMHDPREPYFSSLKRILRYVQALLDHGLQLFPSSTTFLVAYSDADWSGCPTTRRSTSEAEYRGVPNAVTETCCAVYLSSNSVQHQRMKHIEIDIHFVRDLVTAGQVRVLHVPSRYHTFSRYKAHLMTNGSTQLEGVDVDETFSLVVKSVQHVCLRMHDPQEPHFSALKRILRYVRGLLDHGLKLLSFSTTFLVAYSDADWAEAEYCGVANAIAETCCLRNLLRELHTPFSFATLVYYDNISAVYLYSNPVQHQRTKHIKINIHFVRDLVATDQETAPQAVPPKEGQPFNAQAVQAMEAWKHLDFLCHNYILNGLVDSLCSVYYKTMTAKELWESLERKYKTEDAGTCYNCDQPGYRAANCKMPKRVTLRQANMVNDNMDMIAIAAVDNGEKLYMGNSATANIKGEGDNLVSSWLLNKFGFCLVFESDKFVLSKNQMYVGMGYAVNDLCAKHGIRYEFTAPYSPQQNGITDRKNRSLNEMVMPEDSRALKRLGEAQEEKAVKKQKLDEEVAELKRHLQIEPNDEDDVYTEATPLARKVPVVDYEIYTENNKPYYKIIRADGSPQLFLSFLSLLRNFDREDLEVL